MDMTFFKSPVFESVKKMKKKNEDFYHIFVFSWPLSSMGKQFFQNNLDFSLRGASNKLIDFLNEEFSRIGINNFLVTGINTLKQVDEFQLNIFR